MTERTLRLKDVEHLDLSDPDLYRTGPPHEFWSVFRRESPVHWHRRGKQGPPFWSLTKYEDIVFVSRNPDTFVSSRSIAIGPLGTDPGSDEGRRLGLNNMLISSDPPRHGQLRKLVNRGFTPRMVQRLESHIRTIVDDILRGIDAVDEFDFVEEVAAQLPLAVICELLGVPQADWPKMIDLTNRAIGADDPEYQTADSADESGQQAVSDILAYFTWLLGRRRGEARDDLVSVLATAEVEGRRLTDEDILFFCWLLIIAGNETTRNATSGGLLALLEHPTQRHRLENDPDLLGSAVEEILRWTSPVTHMARWTVRDTEMRGQSIRAGEGVVLWYPSANRDEDVFTCPEEFDVGRSPNHHLAFGIGEHFCLGANLARLELRVMFEQLLNCPWDFELAGNVERLRSNFITGIKHIPVRKTPKPARVHAL